MGAFVQVSLEDIQMLNEDAFVLLKEILVEVNRVSLRASCRQPQRKFTIVGAATKHVYFFLGVTVIAK